ncbi:MAG: hypothetical protein ABIV04_05725 [Massilia sp.]
MDSAAAGSGTRWLGQRGPGQAGIQCAEIFTKANNNRLASSFSTLGAQIGTLLSARPDGSRENMLTAQQ